MFTNPQVLVNDNYFLDLVKAGKLVVTTDGKVYNNEAGAMRLLNYYDRSKQYETISYSDPKNSFRRNWRITAHRLTYLVFHGPIELGMLVDHDDDDKRNNHYTNLRKVTNAENIRKRKAPRQATSVDEMKRIIDLHYDDKMSRPDIAELMNINIRTIDNVLRFETKFKDIEPYLTAKREKVAATIKVAA